MITLITGPMGSGKSERLISEYRVCGLFRDNVLAFKPFIENRGGENKISSRCGEEIDAINVNNFNDILQMTKRNNLNTVIIDEVQFLSIEGLKEFAMYVNKNNISVYVGGLMLASEMIPFETTINVAAYSNDFVVYNGKCECGKKAYLTKCKVEKTSEVLIGGDAMYCATCYDCYDK